jgi:hypothetical protein
LLVSPMPFHSTVESPSAYSVLHDSNVPDSWDLRF